MNECTQGLQVLKISHLGSSVCFVATLNSSESALPEALLNATATVSDCYKNNVIHWLDKYDTTSMRHLAVVVKMLPLSNFIKYCLNVNQ